MWLPGAAIPQHHRAAAILALRNRALERAVVERMILDMHRQPLVGGIEAWPLRAGPAQQHTVILQPEIVMLVARVVLLDQIAQFAFAFFRPARARRLGGFRKVALLAVTLKLVHRLRGLALPS